MATKKANPLMDRIKEEFPRKLQLLYSVSFIYHRRYPRRKEAELHKSYPLCRRKTDLLFINGIPYGTFP